MPSIHVSNISSPERSTGMRAGCIGFTTELGVVVRKEKTFVSTGTSSFLSGPFHSRYRPAKANGGRGSSPIKANQCQTAGFFPFGSAKDVTGTRQRLSLKRSRPEPACPRFFIARIRDPLWCLVLLWQDEAPRHHHKTRVRHRPCVSPERHRPGRWPVAMEGCPRSGERSSRGTIA